jgi:hypothetical protein
MPHERGEASQRQGIVLKDNEFYIKSLADMALILLTFLHAETGFKGKKQYNPAGLSGVNPLQKTHTQQYGEV